MQLLEPQFIPSIVTFLQKANFNPPVLLKLIVVFKYPVIVMFSRLYNTTTEVKTVLFVKLTIVLLVVLRRSKLFHCTVYY